MAIIGFGVMNKDLLAIIIGCIFCFLNRLLNIFVEAKLFNNKILTNIFISIANIFTIIPYLIFKKRTKTIDIKNDIKNINKKNNEEEKYEYIYEESYDIQDDIKNKELFIILIGIVFFINYFMFAYTFKIESNTWINYILFTSIFYYLIFKAKLFNYHYLSIVIILLAGLIIDIYQNNFIDDWNKDILGFIFSIIRVILLSFNYVIIKYTMERKFVSPYEIGVCNGLINLILFIIFAIFDHFLFKLNDYADFFNHFNGNELLTILGLMISQLGLYICCFLIDKNNTPCHIFIVFTFGQLAIYIKDVSSSLIVVIISFIIILFFSLVFNEIIELNFFGLSRNTKRNMAHRANDEIKESELMKMQSFDIDDMKDIFIDENALELTHIFN